VHQAGHGKGVYDPFAGDIKVRAWFAMRCGEAINNAKQLFDFCQKNLRHVASNNGGQMSKEKQLFKLAQRFFFLVDAGDVQRPKGNDEVKATEEKGDEVAIKKHFCFSFWPRIRLVPRVIQLLPAQQQEQ
jgi:hypothetical protein